MNDAFIVQIVAYFQKVLLKTSVSLVERNLKFLVLWSPG